MVALLIGCGGGEAERLYREGTRLRLSDDLEEVRASIKKYDESIRLVLLSLEGKYEAWKGYGIKLMEHRMYGEAAEAFEAAIGLRGTDSNVYYYLGLAYANKAIGMRDAVEKKRLIRLAKESYGRALDLDGKNTVVHYALGVLHGFVEGDILAGIRSMEVAHQQEPRDVEILFGLGRLYYESGRLNESADQYRSIVELAPKKSDTHQKALDNLRRIEGEN